MSDLPASSSAMPGILYLHQLCLPVCSKLKEKYKVEITLEQPKVAFRETIRKKADVEYKYKKQSGGHGQYGHVKMTFEPSGNL